MKKYESLILNVLLDQYERSKSFIGKNVQNQSFNKRITDLFPGYDDEVNFELFSEVNLQVESLEKEGLITVKRKKRGKLDTEIISSVSLVVDKIDQCYRSLGRQPKADKNAEIKKILDEYCDKTPLLHDFCEEQFKRLNENKKVQYSDNLEKLEQILKVLAEIESVEEETFIRNFSIRVLGDSKAFENIKKAIVSLLCEYGDYPDKECVLQDLNIVNNPGYVYVKGNGTITVSGQKIDLDLLNGDIGLSSELLKSVESVEVKASKIITIENLTTFNSFNAKDTFVIYLGGYHNSIRRKLICKIYENNPNKKYLHYGDIDAGGFYILQDLRRKTGIQFEPLNMNINTLEKYKEFTKKLSENDKSRLKNLLNSEFASTVKYMLENDCKLEQEAIGE